MPMTRRDAAAGGEEEDLRGCGAREGEVAGGLVSITRVPGVVARTRWLETLPSGIALVVIAMQPAGMPAAAVPSARWVRL